jgi:GrpB-like predicted nucleotidyltransferase (UPF0157 family)
MKKPTHASPTPQLDALVRAEPDLVDRIFDYLLELLPEIAERHLEVKRQIREEFATERVYIRRRSGNGDNPLAQEVARLFNGRNASEVARQLHIGRASSAAGTPSPGRP